jgi:hypothetical protein
MSIYDITIGQLKELQSLLVSRTETPEQVGLNDHVGKKVIIRTYSAGVWFGEIEKKFRNEVIVKGARRLWQWKAARSFTLSGVAVYGINQGESKISPSIDGHWLEAIELIPCSEVAIKSIEGAQDHEPS